MHLQPATPTQALKIIFLSNFPLARETSMRKVYRGTSMRKVYRVHVNFAEGTLGAVGYFKACLLLFSLRYWNFRHEISFLS